MINMIIDGTDVQVPEGSTILDAARKLHIDIPTLCYLHLDGIPAENRNASCRICVVEVKGRKNLAPSCSTPVMEGMEVRTNTVRVLKARKTVLELMLSDHPQDCLTCTKNGQCELQALAEKLGVREIPYDDDRGQSTYARDISAAIVRDMDKCIMCRRCETMCDEIQTVGAISGVGRGFDAVVSTPFGISLQDSVCTFCGQCVAVCPTGALIERDYTWKVVEALSDPGKQVIVQTAPAVRAALGEEFGMGPGTVVTGKMTAALRRLGFDYVFDTNFAADLTIMEEGSELLDRLKRYTNGDESVRLPIFTSCCPAWVKFFEHHYHDMLDAPSTAKSPQQMFGAIAKSYFAEKLGIERDKLVVVSIMPCTAKKFERERDEFGVDGNPDVDIVLTTREIGRLIKQFNIDFVNLPDEDFDAPMGISTGAGAIFGVTGGVLEAATRTIAEWVTGESLGEVDFRQLRGREGIREAYIEVDGTKLHLGIVHGLGNVQKLMDLIKTGKVEQFHAIEVMACPGGCIGGGGQPYHHGNMEIIRKRAEGLYEIDRDKPIRKSHENPAIIELYEQYLQKPLGEKSHHLLHTKYSSRHRI